jgi:hypothetical protein
VERQGEGRDEEGVRGAKGEQRGEEARRGRTEGEGKEKERRIGGNRGTLKYRFNPL